MSDPIRLAVIGNPVAHSRSPELHLGFAKQLGMTLEYDRVECAPGEFIDTANRLRETGYAGANVTVPFKADAFALCDTRTPVAELAQAVNTLHFVDHSVLGDNTDGPGFIRDLTSRCGIDVAHKTVIIIGAGGAVRGLMKPLLDQNPSQVVVAGRSPYNAEAIAERFADFGPVQGCTYLALKGWQADVLIHASPAGHSGRMPALRVPEDAGWEGHSRPRWAVLNRGSLLFAIFQPLLNLFLNPFVLPFLFTPPFPKAKPPF